MKTKFFLCADSTTIDSRTNTISAFHIYEEAQAASYPLVLPRLAILVSIEREPSESNTPPLSLQGNLADLPPLFTVPINVTFSSDKTTARIVADINGLVIPAPGILHLSLLFNGESLATWDVKFNKGEPPVARTVPLPPAASAIPTPSTTFVAQSP